MRPPRETLAVGIQQHHRQHQRREKKSQAVKFVGCQDEHSGCHHYERAHKCRRKLSRGQRTRTGARISSIHLRVRQPIKSHGRRARAHHGDHDPGELPARGDSTSRQHGAAKSEWEGKDRVLPLDHFQRGGGAAQNAHTIILGDRNEIRSTKDEVRSKRPKAKYFDLRTSYFLLLVSALRWPVRGWKPPACRPR